MSYQTSGTPSSPSLSNHKAQQTTNITPRMPRQTIRGRMREVESVVHLPCTSKHARRIITCSKDGSLRLWDLESDTQIGDDWRDGGEHARIRSIALSPNGKIVASGSNAGIVRLWDVEIGNVIAKWTGHTDYVCSVCWSPNGEQVVSGSWDGTARVWGVEARHPIPYLALLQTGHDRVFAVVYSPDGSKIATGGYNENAVKIWDTKSGELLFTVGRGHVVWNLAWTSDGKKLISVSAATRSIGIFDTTTWQQTATLQGANAVCTIALSPNDRLLASASHNTARLWHLDTNLPVGLPFQHESSAHCTAFSADGTRLVTGCDENVYVWDIDAILKDAGLEGFPNLDANQLPPGSFNDTQDRVQIKDHTWWMSLVLFLCCAMYLMPESQPMVIDAKHVCTLLTAIFTFCSLVLS